MFCNKYNLRREADRSNSAVRANLAKWIFASSLDSPAEGAPFGRGSGLFVKERNCSIQRNDDAIVRPGLGTVRAPIFGSRRFLSRPAIILEPNSSKHRAAPTAYLPTSRKLPLRMHSRGPKSEHEEHIDCVQHSQCTHSVLVAICV